MSLLSQCCFLWGENVQSYVSPRHRAAAPIATPIIKKKKKKKKAIFHTMFKIF
jgi:hypothetical protein